MTGGLPPSLQLTALSPEVSIRLALPQVIALVQHGELDTDPLRPEPGTGAWTPNRHAAGRTSEETRA